MNLIDKIDAKLDEGSISTNKLESNFQKFRKDTKNYIKSIDAIAKDIQSADNAVGGTSMIKDNNIVILKSEVQNAISRYMSAVKQVALEYKHIEKE